MAKALIIVESPAKARTISRFLGDGYVVESSIGHIRDLPAKPTEIPPSVRGKPWARTGVDIEGDFEPVWVVPAEKRAQVKKLKDQLKGVSTLYLATDEDREGEAIAWHLYEVLKPKIPTKRMVFHEITDSAIKRALREPREIDRALVSAQEARRILDRLYGYEISPVLWRKIRPRLSAGRVQSVATRLVVERERARMAFRSGVYWSLSATLSGANDKALSADLQQLDGRRIAIGKHFDPASGQLSEAAKAEGIVLLDESICDAIRSALGDGTVTIADVERKPFTQRPAPPFITSTLQQDAGRKLRYTAQRTMRIAQRLYEQGYITYMRTDSTSLSEQALGAARSYVADAFGADFLPEEARRYTKKRKGAQEAHEAIRPAGDTFRTPESLKGELDDDALALYSLVFRRTVASQMKDARGERTRVVISAPLGLSQPIAVKEATLVASGRVITFPGFLKVYDLDTTQPDDDRLLPAVETGEQLSVGTIETEPHNTQPPARFTEATLVRELEERGIGRPSTYASIIQTIQDRGYVFKHSTALVPTLTAFAVVRLLEEHFYELVDYDFTARMEEDLDLIGSGDREARPWLRAFYFGEEGCKPTADPLTTGGLHGLVGSGVDAIDPREVCSIDLGKTSDGQSIAARVGRYGPYIQVGDSDERAPLPPSILPDSLNADEALRLMEQRHRGNRQLGEDPATGKPIYVKTGAYGPYVQLGDPELTPKGNLRKGGKPKMASLWPGMDPETLTLDQALDLLSYPKVLGTHPETGLEVTVQDGKFGPYIEMRGETARETRSLTDHQQMATLDLAGAIALFAQPRKGGRSARRVLAELGTSEVTGGPIEVRTGRFGPYVTDGQVNATIPRGREPQTITLSEALELIKAREEKMRDEGKDPRAEKQTKKKAAKKASKKAPASKKTAAKKTASKKKAAKKAPAKKKTAKETSTKASPAKKTTKKAAKKRAKKAS